MDTRARPSISRRLDAIAVALLCALVVSGWLPRLKGPIDLRWDGGAYYSLGTALAEGKGYRILTEPGDPQSTLHPPLLPALIAGHQLVLGTSDPMAVGRALRTFYFVLSVIYAVAVYALLRTRLSVVLAVCGAAMCVLNDRLCFLSDLCYPEVPFALVSVGCVLASGRAGRVGQAATFLCAAAAYALRTVGITLLAAWVLDSLLRRQFRTAALRVVAASVPVLAWQGYVRGVETGHEYSQPAYAYQRAAYVYFNVSYARNIVLKDPFAPELGRADGVDLLWRFLGNVARMPVSIGEAVTSSRQIWGKRLSTASRRLPGVWVPPWIGTALVAALAAMVAFGLLVQLRRRQWFVPIYAIAYVALVCSTPWPGQFGRYLTPLAPVLALSLLVGVRTLDGLLRDRARAPGRAVGRVGIAAMLGLGIAQQVDARHRMFRDFHDDVVGAFASGEPERYRLLYYRLRSYDDVDSGLAWLKAHRSGREVVTAADPFWVSLNTGRDAVLPPLEVDTEKAQAFLDGVPVRFLILDLTLPEVGRYAEAVVRDHPGLWERVFSTADGGAQIYERRERRAASASDVNVPIDVARPAAQSDDWPVTRQP